MQLRTDDLEGRPPLAETLRAIARRAAWPPVLVFTVHAIASRAMHAYARWPLLDVPMHLLGGVAIAFFFERALAVLREARELGPADPRLEPVLLMALVGTSTVLWEFSEFFADRLLGTRAQLGLEDTLADMAIGLAGGALYLGWRSLRSAARA